VGGIAGFGGGILGAVIGAWGSRDVANRTIADARRARADARKDATAAMFLQERRAAILAVLTKGEAAAQEAAQSAVDLKADRPDLGAEGLTTFRQAWLELILLAPHLTSGAAGAYSVGVAEYVGSFWEWSKQRQLAMQRGAVGAGPAPKRVTDAVQLLADSRSTFLRAAMDHLGVTAYAQPDIGKVLGSLTATDLPPA
jgi:hypothetical protein